MLVVRNPEHLAQVVAKAAREAHLTELVEQLHYLATYADSECQCVLYPDVGAPLTTLTFDMLRKRDGEWVLWFNGGLAFHGSDGTWGVHT